MTVCTISGERYRMPKHRTAKSSGKTYMVATIHAQNEAG